MGSKEENSVADVKPFSIRQYVLACRHGNVLNCWPFAEKFLQLCLSRGLKDVLPPFQQCTTLAEPVKGSSNLNSLQDANNNDNNADFREIEEPELEPQKIRSEFELFSGGERSKVTSHVPLSHEGGNHHDCNISDIVSPEADTFSQPSSTFVHKKSAPLTTKQKWRRRRGKFCKKKPMAEILAAAKHCTVEDLQRINKFCYIGSEIEACHQMGPLENSSEITYECSTREAESDEHEVANVDMKGRSTSAFKKKLNGY